MGRPIRLHNRDHLGGKTKVVTIKKDGTCRNHPNHCRGGGSQVEARHQGSGVGVRQIFVERKTRQHGESDMHICRWGKAGKQQKEVGEAVRPGSHGKHDGAISKARSIYTKCVIEA